MISRQVKLRFLPSTPSSALAPHSAQHAVGTRATPRRRRAPSETESTFQKEAVVPDQLSGAEAQHFRLTNHLTNQNRLVKPEHAHLVFNFYGKAYEPFSTVEELKFALAFKDDPKDFLKIAELLPGRNRLDCQNHYYTHKHDHRFTIESMNQKAAETKASKKLFAEVKRDLMAKQLNISLLPKSDVRIVAAQNGQAWVPEEALKHWEDWFEAVRPSKPPRVVPDIRDLIPIDLEIDRLRGPVSRSSHQAAFKAYARRDMEQTTLPRPDITLLVQTFQYPFPVEANKILSWLRSPAVLMVVKECIEALLTYDNFYLDQFLALVPNEAQSQANFIQDIATLAQRHGTKDVGNYNVPHQGLFKIFVRATAMIAHGSRLGFFAQWWQSVFPEHLIYQASASVLVSAWLDLEHVDGGFWELLLDSKLAGPMKPAVRQAWEQKFPFEGEDAEDEDALAESATNVDNVGAELPSSQTKDNNLTQKQNKHRDSMLPDGMDDIQIH